MKKQDKKIDLKNLTSKDKMKYEIADGWKSLSARETGRIGGIMTRRMREAEKKKPV